MEQRQNTIQEPLITRSLQKFKDKKVSISKHLKLLLQKNYLIFKRHPFQLIFLIVGPILVNCFILLSQHLSDKVFQGGMQNPQQFAVLHDIKPVLPKCQDDPYQRNKNCVSIGISVVGDKTPWVDFAIENLKKTNGFSDDDVQILHQSSSYIIPYSGLFGRNSMSFSDYLQENPGKVQLGVQFCNGKILMPDIHNKKLDKLLYTSDCQHMHLRSHYKQKEPYISKLENKIKYKNTYQENFYEQLDDSQTRYYTMYLNTTQLFNPFQAFFKTYIPTNPTDTTLKMQLDQFIINFEKQEKMKNNQNNNPQIDINDGINLEENETENSEVDINVQYASFPYTKNRYRRHYVIANRQGAFFFFIGFLFIFTLMQSEIVREKEYRLRQGLNIFGVKHITYWLSWFITGFILVTFLTIFVICLGIMFDFQVFKDTRFQYWVLLFWPLGMGMLMMSFFVSTLVPNLKMSNTIQYAFILFALVVEIFLCADKTIKYLYLNDNPTWLVVLRSILYIYPPFNYSALYLSYSILSDRHKNGMDKQHFIKMERGTLRGDPYTKPSPLLFALMLQLNWILYMALAFYCDNVVASNRGRSRPWYFLFTQKFWCPGKYKQKRQLEQKQKVQRKVIESVENNQNLLQFQQQQQKEQNREKVYSNDILQKLNQNNKANSNSMDDLVFNSAQDQKNKILYDQTHVYDKDVKGIRISGLTKSYDIGNIFKKKKKMAIYELYLQLFQNQTCAFLGHNGAGKTTLINVLTGMLDYDEGQVIINGLDLEYEIEEIRKQIGICPQFDILWNELTAEEHISLFCQIKGIDDKEQIDNLVKSKLKQVNLTHVRNAQTQTYSGGMKRRLSIVISCIGNPQILFLDEPTTGMDPKSRREVWDLIKQVKENKSIMLTSHSMEEADILSDRIVVISDGQLKCAGTSLQLKNTYGGGYRIDTVSSKDDQIFIAQSMRNIFPNSRLLDSAGGSLVFQLKNDQSDFKKFFSIMESNIKDLEKEKQKLDPLKLSLKIQYINDKITLVEKIKDWGVQNATLEEVFITLTSKKESKLVKQQQQREKEQIIYQKLSSETLNNSSHGNSNTNSIGSINSLNNLDTNSLQSNQSLN